MDYVKKLNELKSLYDLPNVSDKYPNANDFEICVLTLRNFGWSYAEIQKPLGMPAKKAIRAVLTTFDPKLVEKDVNKEKRAKKCLISPEEGKFRYKCITTGKWQWNLQDEDYTFEIRDNLLYFKDSEGYEMKFSELDETTRKQFLDEQSNN